MRDPDRLHRLLAALAPHMAAHTSDIEAMAAARRLRPPCQEELGDRTERAPSATARRLFT